MTVFHFLGPPTHHTPLRASVFSAQAQIQRKYSAHIQTDWKLLYSTWKYTYIVKYIVPFLPGSMTGSLFYLEAATPKMVFISYSYKPNVFPYRFLISVILWKVFASPYLTELVTQLHE